MLDHFRANRLAGFRPTSLAVLLRDLFFEKALCSGTPNPVHLTRVRAVLDLNASGRLPGSQAACSSVFIIVLCKYAILPARLLLFVLAH